MRTTIEITADQRVALTALAARRGLRGFSALVQEAIDEYLAENADDELTSFLALEGSLSDEEADQVEGRIAELRSAPWRAVP
jgi:hypothetical protein